MFSIKPANGRGKYAIFSFKTVFFVETQARANKFPKKIIPSARFSFIPVFF